MGRLVDIFRPTQSSRSLADGVPSPSIIPTTIRAGSFALETLPGRGADGGPAFQFTNQASPFTEAFAERFPRSLSDLDTLRSSVAPGASALRRSLLDQVESSRRRAIGTLSENLQRRRVLGSSFGADALARAEAEFSKEARAAEAQAAIFETEATAGALAQEQQFLLNAQAQELQKLGIATGFAQAMLGLGQQAASQNQALQVQARQADEQIRLQSAQFQHNMIMDIGQMIGAGVAASSRTLKDGFSDVDVLSALMDAPVQGWSYRDDPEKRPHIGPMAEDVFVTLGIGDGKFLPLSDMLGVTLRAVQQLAHEVRELRQEMAK